MKLKHTIINSDCRIMKDVNNEAIDLVVTSPPYWQLKDYGTDEQIGFNDSYEKYINNLNLVWKECYRVLKPGSRLCVNIGDQFARAIYYGRYKVIPIRTEIIRFCESIGFDYMGAIIWQKKTTTNTTGGASLMGSYPYPKNGILSLDYEFILIFKKLGTPQKVKKEIKELSRLTIDEWKVYFSGHWNFGGVKQTNHIAMFPMELPHRLIKMFSFVGDTVLDPFLGSGTTSLAAKKLNRNSIGYEINPDFLDVIKDKLEVNIQEAFTQNNYEFIKREVTANEISKRLDSLDNKFIDYQELKPIISPKKLNFGSRISVKDNNKDLKFQKVIKINSPEKITLSDDLVVKLIGIKTNQEKKEKAIEFLNKKILNRQVFLKFDVEKLDENNTLLAYVYLKNKTFVNAHLIKEGLVSVNINSNFKHKNKFIKLEKNNG